MDIICMFVYSGAAVAVLLIFFGLMVAFRPSPTERIIRRSQTIGNDAANQVRAAAEVHLRNVAGKTGAGRRYQYVSKEESRGQEK
jgi:hypothetical protein